MGYVADKIIERRQEKEQKELDQAKKDIDRLYDQRDSYGSVWSSLRETWWRIALGAFLLYVSYRLVGWPFTMAMAASMSLLIFLYTDRKGSCLPLCSGGHRMCHRPHQELTL